MRSYAYGKQLVPISKMNEDVLKFVEERCLKLLGFTDASKVKREYFMSGVDMVLPSDSPANKRAFSSLVHAMLETEKVMLVKWIARKNATPHLAVLTPYVGSSYECMWLNILPTVEEIRDYQFPSMKESTEGQRRAAKAFVSALDLTEAKGEEEKLKPSSTFNPALQYLN